MKKLALLSLLVLTARGETYKIQSPSGVKEIASEEYVAGVVTGEAGELKEDEALRAMAIAARTYAARMKGRHTQQGYDFCVTTHCQRYVPASARGRRLAAETSGQFLWFQGKLAFTPYSRSCGGGTEAVGAVWPDITAPYLKAHPDPYCHSNWQWAGSRNRIGQALLQAGIPGPPKPSSISVIRRTDSGRAHTLSIDGVLLSASTFRFAMGRYLGWNTIRSDKYDVVNATSSVVFQGVGEGHGVGLCQIGANAMAAMGKSYRQILAFYYPGAAFEPNELTWVRSSGEGVVLFSPPYSDNRPILSQAEAAMKRWQGRLPWPSPPNIDIYVYPDLDSFRNATGEPGWVAARTRGLKIQMQPAANSQTLEHEIIHVLMEQAAQPRLPVWFREGLAGHLMTAGHAAERVPVDEDNLRQRSDQTKARNAYRNATSRVDALARTYGEGAVLSWVTAGLPAEVRNSNNSNPPVNNK